MDNVIEKKKKKKKSHKNLEEEFQSDSILNISKPVDPNVSNVENPTEKKKKKKKKKDHLDSSMDDRHMEVHGDSEIPRKRESSGPETSPTKKQKKTKKRESIEAVNDDEMEIKMELVEQNGQDTDPWTQEEKMELLSRIRNEKLTQTEECSFRITLGKSKWNWENICSEKRNAEECQAAFSDMIKHVIKIKTLKQIVEAAELSAQSGKKKTNSAYNLFIKEYCAKHKGQRCTQLPSVSNAWKDLPEEEKTKYRVAVTNINDENKPPPRPRQPFDMFYSEKIESTGIKQTKEQRIIYRKKYDELKFKKKLKYIEMSFKDIFKYEKQAQEYKEKYPAWDMKKPLVSKDNIELYLHTLHEMPKQPPKQANMTYYHELLESGKLEEIKGKEKLTSSLKLYAQLPEKEKASYQESTKQKLNEYHEKYADWRKKQDEIVGTYADRYYKPEKPPKEKTPKQPKEKTIKSPKQPAFENTIATSMIRPKFAGEPKSPPATVYKLFAANFIVQAKSQFTSMKDKTMRINKAWEDLNTNEKEIYQKRCEELKNKFARRLLTFVSSLDKHARKTYLGYHRATYHTYFKSDIFEKYYPNAKYPVYISSPVKRATKIKSTSVSEQKSLSLSSSSDEEESTNLKKGQKKLAEQHSPKSPLAHLMENTSSDEEETNKQTDSDPSTNSDEDDLQKMIPTDQESESDSDDDVESKQENEPDSDEDVESKQENESDSDEDVESKQENESDSDEDVEIKQENDSDSDDDSSEAANISKAWEIKKSATKKKESSSSSDDSD